MGFTFAAFCYLVALLAVAFCIFFAIYTVICIDELRTDYKNPIDQCKNLNQLILPEYLIHMTFSVLFVFSLQLFAILWNAPLVAYHIHRYINRPVMTGPGIYDPTTIMNHDQLQKVSREGWIKLGFYLLSFFYYLYATVQSSSFITGYIDVCNGPGGGGAQQSAAKNLLSLMLMIIASWL